jgi:ribonuclease J
MKLTFFGGINEIGGNKIFLEDRDTKLFFDFGFSFSKAKKYFSEFLQPRIVNGLGDFLEFGILPDIEGIYRDDYLKQMGRKPTITPAIDGVFISHAHADHSWNIAFLHKDMPIYCGETCKLFLKAAQESSLTRLGQDFYRYKEAFVDRKKPSEYERNFHTFRTGDRIKIGSVEIVPYHTDHSIPGNYGFIIYSPDATIVYTGDIRIHGPKKWMTREFIEKAREAKPDILIIEGTRIEERGRGLTEWQVKQKVKNFISKTKELVLVNFPLRDVDRFNSFYHACKESDRKLAITTKQAYLLETLKEDKKLNIPRINDENILVYIHRAGWGRIAFGDIKIEEVERDYYRWERKFLNLENSVNFKDVNSKQKEIVLYCDFFDLKELIDIKPKVGSRYIYSLSEPHDEEAEIDFNKMLNWLEHFKLPMLQVHASGHASREDLMKIIKFIRPKITIPVHTEYPFSFLKLSKFLKMKVKLPKINETIHFK